MTSKIHPDMTNPDDWDDDAAYWAEEVAAEKRGLEHEARTYTRDRWGRVDMISAKGARYDG